MQQIDGLLGHTTRIRRGWFDIIGKGAKVLFGTMDSDDAEHYDTLIKQSEENSRVVTTLVKDQINIVRTTILTVNNTLKAVTDNQKILFQSLGNITNAINNNKEHIERIYQEVSADEHISLFNTYLSQYSFDVLTLFQSILDARRGSLHPSILSPTEVVAQLKIAQQNLPTGLELPTTPDEEHSHLIFDVASIVSFFNNNNFVFVVKIPLLDVTQYYIYELQPLPAHVLNNNFITILPNDRYIAVDDSKQLYFYLNEAEISHCHKFETSTLPKFICKQNSFVKIAHVEQSCEIALIVNNNIQTIPNSCNKKLIHLNNTLFIKLHSLNSWAFVTTMVDTVIISCIHMTPFDVKINGTGSITIANNCRGYAKSGTLNTQASIQNQTSPASFVPTLNISTICCSQILLKKLNSTKLRHPSIGMKAYDNFIQDIGAANHNLDHLEMEVLKEEEAQRHATTLRHTSIIGYVVASTVIFVGVLILVHRVVRRRRRLPPPTRPRQFLALAPLEASSPEEEAEAHYMASTSQDVLEDAPPAEHGNIFAPRRSARVAQRRTNAVL